MWVTVLMLALWMSTDPFRLFIGGFLVSRPKPLQNLIAYWFGGMVGGLVASLFVIVLLRDFALPIMKTVTATVSDFTGGYVRVALGVLALMFAAQFAARMVVVARQQVGVPMDAAGPSSVALQARPVQNRPAFAEQIRAGLQRLTPPAVTRFTSKIMSTLGSGNPRVSFVAGLMTALPPMEHQAALTAIMASGAGVGEQLTASMMFVVVVLLALEIILVGYLFKPAKTEALVERLREWMRSAGQKLLPVTTAAAGVFLVYTGIGAI